MKVSIWNWVLLACIVIVLTITDRNLCAASEHRKHSKVHITNFKGEAENKFKTDESVYVKGSNFEPLTNVDVYVTENKKWVNGDPLTGTDISSDGVETIQTTSNGNILKTMVWGAPTVVGKYDIVVDANQDGTFDTGDGDAVDNKSIDPGFKVKRFLP